MSPRTLAVTFTLLLFASGIPPAEARHTDHLLGDIPVLPHARPEQSCFPTGVSEDILARLNDAVEGDPAFYQNDLGVPSVCIGSGPVPEFYTLVTQLDALLERVRNASREAQRQVDVRLEATLPEFREPTELVQPRTVLLNDSFDGRRYTGFGDWEVVTERGEAPVFEIQQSHTENGTRNVYRFGNATGYERGAHQWLVSPEIDLTAVNANRTIMRELAELRDDARRVAFSLCYGSGLNFGLGSVSLSQVCGGNAGSFLPPELRPPVPLDALVRAYEMAFDATIMELPVMQHGAYIEFTYRLNMAPGEDGVRVWLYSGERQPDRAVLFGPDFGEDAIDLTCLTDSPVNDSNARTATNLARTGCARTVDGGTHAMMFPGANWRGVRNTRAFQASDAPANNFPFALSGDVEHFNTVRLNVTELAGERLWLLFEVKTLRNDRGQDIFNDQGRFTRLKDYGFELARVYAEGDAFHRNMRVKEVAPNYPYVSLGNLHGDDPRFDRTTVPPGNEPVVVYLHNAGDYTERMDLVVTAERASAAGTSFTAAGEANRTTHTLRPDEVRAVQVPWSSLLRGNPLEDDRLYRVTARIEVYERNETRLADQTRDLGQTPPVVDPNSTQARPVNAANEQNTLRAGNTTLSQRIRADTALNLTIVRADSEPGVGIQFCSSIEGRRCTELVAGRKGEPREILVGVRNDGNAAQDAVADLIFELDGVLKNDAILDGPRRELTDLLPGEMRPVSWRVIPTEPGAYRVAIALTRGDGQPETLVERRMFVQRSTGLLCVDTLLEMRECGPAFTGDAVAELRGENITAAALAPDGTLYVATDIQEESNGVHSGLLAARDPITAEWRILANLSGSILNGTLGAPIADLGWGDVRSLVLGANGTLWLLGDNATALRWDGVEGALPARVPLVGVAEGTDAVASDRPHLRAAIWHNDTLLAAGSNGTFLRLENGSLHRFTIERTNVSSDGKLNKTTYNGTLRALLATPDGHAYAAGDEGFLAVSRAGASLTDWTEAEGRSKLLTFELNNSTRFRTLAYHNGRVLAAGDGVFVANVTNDVGDFTSVRAPPTVPHALQPAPRFGPYDIHALVAGHDGDLYAIDFEGRVSTCRVACAGITAKWDVIEVPRPPVFGKGPTHPARLALAAADAERTFLLGEAGVLLLLDEVGEYMGNDKGWSVVTPLAPHDGGLLQTKRTQVRPGGMSQPQSVLAFANTTQGQLNAQSGDLFRYFMNHSVDNASATSAVEVRLVYVNVPNLVSSNPSAETCNVPADETAGGLGTRGVCQAPRIRHVVARYDRPSIVGEWDRVQLENVPSAVVSAAASFHALEFWADQNARWAIDDFHLQARVGGEWRTVMQFLGPKHTDVAFYVSNVRNATVSNDPVKLTPLPYVRQEVNDPPKTSNASRDAENAGNETAVNRTEREAQKEEAKGSLNETKGDVNDSRTETAPGQGDAQWDQANATSGRAADDVDDNESAQTSFRDSTYNSTDNTTRDASRTAGGQVATGTGTVDSTVNADEPRWELWSEGPFDQTLNSPWHLTTQYADRPVFAANNEFFVVNNATGGNLPRLLSNWDARLLTPVIDLSDAFDPVITFRHTYAFRLKLRNTDPEFILGDGGVLELQYLLEGEECPHKVPGRTCGWSRFYPIRPDGGYPTLDELGLSGLTSWADRRNEVSEPGRVGLGASYFGRIAIPDASGVINDPRLTDTYVTERISLRTYDAATESGVQCTQTQKDAIARGQHHDCIPVNLTGRQVRLAFRLMTTGGAGPQAWKHQADGTYPTDIIFNESTRVSSATDPRVASYAGEGWYITDLKVLGAPKLGVDLVASELALRVGYDVAEIGVGPGTTVPVNVTVTNKGTFDALGYTGRLEVHRVLDRALQVTTLVETEQLSQQPVLEAGKWRNHTLSWTVPSAEGAEYVLKFVLTPVGIERDEDPTDNVVRIGSVAAPLKAQTVRRFSTEFLVSPENATIDITRYVPMFINNTGNVPLDAFQVERRITILGRTVRDDAATCADWRERVAAGRPTAIVECSTWTTAQPAPAGQRTAVASISSDLDPTSDLFWKAPERASYRVVVSASTSVAGEELRDAADMLVSAFATYLFDDIEGGPRGESMRGSWAFGPGWNASQPGFRSPESYAFGDPLIGRYAPAANDSLVTPVIDLGNARTATLAFYHKYGFEPRFDGGIIEASDDGGQTWTPLVPLGAGVARAGYNASLPLQPSSPLHPSGDPDVRDVTAFTGNSSLHPASVDGWLLTVADLTGYANVTESGVAYEAYTSSEIQGFGAADVVSDRAPNVMYAKGWCPGLESEFRCWEVENLTERTRVAPTPSSPGTPNTMWWSGSAQLDDDGRRPIQNHALFFDIDIASVESDEIVTAEWWEYASRFNQVGSYLRAGQPGALHYPSDLLTVYSFHPLGEVAQTYRFNLGRPEVVEKDDKWYHMRSDLTPLVTELRKAGHDKIRIGFAYTPLSYYHHQIYQGTNLGLEGDNAVHNAERETLDNDQNSSYGGGIYEDDPGFLIDGFRMDARRLAGGQTVGAPRVLAQEGDDLWGQRLVKECGLGKLTMTGTTSPWQDGNPSAPACLGETADNRKFWILRDPLLESNQDNVGRNWAVIDALPAVNATWRVVDVKDRESYSSAKKLPTGDTPKAWWTGEPHAACGSRAIHNVDGRVKVPCPQPNSESRLVTPAFDLGRIAGNNAQLTFWHRYAFSSVSGSGGIDLASGGVVEMQEYDAQTGTWGEWKQLYSAPLDLQSRGGYTRVTANTTDSTEGVRHFDPPFHSVEVDGADRAVQFLYSGQSGWTRATFDVSEHLGKRVRFGFHAYFSDEPVSAQADRLDAPDNASAVSPDGISFGTDDAADDVGGWWVSDVAVVGNVIVGKPVQLRFRAASDANVQDGGAWQIDDLGVFGSRYRNNLGLFVDQTPAAFGAYPNSTVAIPVTIRNLGSQVAAGLAVEVLNAEPRTMLNFTAPGAPAEGFGTGVFRMEGFTLGPGQAVTVDLLVTTSPNAPAIDRTKLIMRLVQESPTPLTPFVPIVDNEVQGLLSRTVDFRLQRDPRAEVVSTVIRAVGPLVGEPVDLEVTYRNTGFGPSVVNITCRAEVVSGWTPVNHDGGAPADLPVVEAAEPCIVVSGASPSETATGVATVLPKEDVTVVLRAVPTKAGFLQFRVNGTIAFGGELPVKRVGVAVGVSPLNLATGFDDINDLNEEIWARQPPVSWEHLRGDRAPGSLLVGISENASASGLSYNSPGPNGCSTDSGEFEAGCRAITRPIDLHNYSRETPAFLTFSHMERLAKYDGATVLARVLLNEERGSTVRGPGWSPPCIVRPIGGYEGDIFQIPTVPPSDGAPGVPGDTNPAMSGAVGWYDETKGSTFEQYGTHDFFVSDNGMWEDSWQQAVFDLSQPCVQMGDRTVSRTLVGQTVRFEFVVFAGANPNDPRLGRGPGQGWLIDDVTVGPYSLAMRPVVPQRAELLDNTTKAFHVVVTNRGSAADIVRLELDAGNSSADPESVGLPLDPVLVAPGESRLVAVNVTLPRDPSLLPTDYKVRLIARSALNPTARAGTMLDLAFAPRQWAELAVSAELPRTAVQEGTETFLPITIENNGLVASVPTKVRIVDTWATGSATYELDLAPIESYVQAPEDYSRVLEFRWRPERGSVGPHTLTFEVDPDRLGEEYTRLNNVVQLVVPVTDLLIADLDVGSFEALDLRNAMGALVTPALDADVARYEVTAGELVSFQLKVANTGRAGATNVDVRAFIGSLSLPPKTIPYIAPGTEVAVTFNWLAQKGEHEVEFLVRSDQVEFTSANNRYPGRGVTLLTVKGYEVEVTIDPLLAILEPGTTVSVPFRVHNAGNAGEDLLLVASPLQGAALQLPREAFFLRAGETYEAEARLVLDAAAVAGEHLISIDAIARENPMKVATGRAPMRVLASYGGSIAGGLGVGAPPEIVLPIELVNEGNSLEPWSVRAALPAGWTAVDALPAKVVVPAHDRTTYEMRVRLPATTAPGDRDIRVFATMADGTAREGIVRATVVPLRAASVSVEEVSPQPARGALSVPIVVENKGNVQQPFDLLLVDAPEGIALRVSPASFDLAPGEKATAQLLVDPDAAVEAGTYSVTGYTLFAGVAPQTDEGRANVQTLRVPIVRQDLRLSPIEYAPRAGLDAGDRVTVKVSVMNRGLADLTDVPVHLYVDDVFIEEVVLATIASGGRVDVTFNWTATNGVHTLTAVVDPYGDAVELDRADNAVSVLATVGADAEGLAGGVAAGRADTPGPGLLGLALALAFALGLTRMKGSRRQRR